MKAVVKIGGKQFIVAEKQTLLVDKLVDLKNLTLDPLMVFDDKEVKIGKPTVAGASVKFKVLDEEVKAKKVNIIKFQAKKRVKKMAGHRQVHTRIEVTSISA